MDANYTFKEEYYTQSGVPVVRTGYNVRYYSPIAVGTVATKSNPARMKRLSGSWTGDVAHIMADGYHNIISFNNSSVGALNHFIGNDSFRTTFLYGQIKVYGRTGGASQYFRDVTIDLQLSSEYPANFYFYKCDIRNLQNFGPVNWSNMSQCVIRQNINTSGSSNSYVGITSKNIYNNNLSLVERCNVVIDQSALTDRIDLYYAFNDCLFKIGGETEYTALSGDTEEELRASFVARCNAQGLTCGTKTEYGETLPMYRWVFARNSSADGAVLINSIIHNFEKRRFVYFGYTSVREGVVVRQGVNTPGSISLGNPHNNAEIKDNAISLPSDSNITKKITAGVQSGIYWLGGLRNLNEIDIVHNFEMRYGVQVDSSPNIENVPTISGNILPGDFYVVRSTDANIASVVYNGTTYTSALSTRDNIFLGGSSATFTSSANAQVYKLISQVQYKTIDMRIVNKIPDEQITAGNLTAGYWYLVEHDTDQANTTDYITYRDVKYPPLASFLADSSDLTFKKSGNIHLRRCWKDNFDFATETTDKPFWQNEQKPKWFKVIGSDLRCLMHRNVSIENEMQTDSEGNYLTTGHPDFYKIIVGDNGAMLPAFPIKGTYMQIALTISTLNPM